MLPPFLVQQLSVRQKLTILEDDLKNVNEPKNEDALKNKNYPKYGVSQTCRDHP